MPLYQRRAVYRRAANARRATARQGRAGGSPLSQAGRTQRRTAATVALAPGHSPRAAADWPTSRPATRSGVRRRDARPAIGVAPGRDDRGNGYTRSAHGHPPAEAVATGGGACGHVVGAGNTCHAVLEPVHSSGAVSIHPSRQGDRRISDGKADQVSAACRNEGTVACGPGCGCERGGLGRAGKVVICLLISAVAGLVFAHSVAKIQGRDLGMKTGFFTTVATTDTPPLATPPREAAIQPIPEASGLGQDAHQIG